MEKMLSFDEFTSQVMTGESRTAPGTVVGYIIIQDSEGEELFYIEWAYQDIEVDETGEVTPDGWSEVERQDEAQLPAAYEAYEAYVTYVERDNA